MTTTSHAVGPASSQVSAAVAHELVDRRPVAVGEERHPPHRREQHGHQRGQADAARDRAVAPHLAADADHGDADHEPQRRQRVAERRAGDEQRRGDEALPGTGEAVDRTEGEDAEQHRPGEGELAVDGRGDGAPAAAAGRVEQERQRGRGEHDRHRTGQVGPRAGAPRGPRQRDQRDHDAELEGDRQRQQERRHAHEPRRKPRVEAVDREAVEGRIAPRAGQEAQRLRAVEPGDDGVARQVGAQRHRVAQHQVGREGGEDEQAAGGHEDRVAGASRSSRSLGLDVRHGGEGRHGAQGTGTK
ncbi:MAG: hypothetical protein U0W40_19695 [Acidimicrobiia bacterium]